MLPERVAWLPGTVTLAPQEGQANVCPAAVSSTVSFVSHVGHGNLRSIGPNGLRRGGYRNNGFKTIPQCGWRLITSAVFCAANDGHPAGSAQPCGAGLNHRQRADRIANAAGGFYPGKLPDRFAH